MICAVNELRIVHAADFHNRLPGSFVRALIALAQDRRARGDQFTLLVPRVAGASWYTQFEATGATLVVVDDPAKMRKTVSNLRPDVLHVHFYGWLVPLTLGMIGRRGRVFWHIHSGDSRTPGFPARLTAWGRFRILGARCEKILAVSHAVAAELRRFGATSRKVTVIPNAVDIAHFRPPTKDEREAARTKLGVPNGSRVIVFFGRDAHIKGTDRLVAALGALPEATLLAVGVHATALAPIRERSILLDDTDDVRSLYWASDALAMPSRVEGMPYTLLEASATGLPAVTSTIAPLREAADSIRSVSLAETDDPQAFARVLRASFAGRPDGAQSLSAHSIEQWVRHIDAAYGSSSS